MPRKGTKEEINKKQKEWRQANPEKWKAICDRYSAKNKNKLLEKGIT